MEVFMGWSLKKCLGQAGIPSAIFAIGYSVKDIINRQPGESTGEIVLVNVGLMAALWLVVSIFLVVITRIFPRAR
jgi:hypothetical protein